ncbi:MAG: hypothetical protein EXS43_09200 [Opitutus sp.]|nr:hypothetical protein [Opitutus sp.]
MRWSRRAGGSVARWQRAGLVVGLFVAGLGNLLHAGPDSSRPWDPAAPLPQFITHVYVDPSYLTAISKYRSVAGHSFSDNYEKAGRSLKNYFEPRRSLLGKPPSIPVFAPATGTLSTIAPEGSLLASGEPRGYQISLASDGYPAFEIRLFHVAVASSVRAGMRVTAGDALGFANVQEGIDFDWAVGAAWHAPPLFDMNGGNQVPKAPGYRLVSPFDLMDDETFAKFAPYGVTDRSAFIVPSAYRDAHPTAATGGDLSHFDDVEYVTLQPPEGPVIDFPPVNQHTAVGGSALLSTSASFYFGPPLSYQWNKNGVPLDASIGGFEVGGFLQPERQGVGHGFLHGHGDGQRDFHGVRGGDCHGGRFHAQPADQRVHARARAVGRSAHDGLRVAGHLGKIAPDSRRGPDARKFLRGGRGPVRSKAGGDSARQRDRFAGQRQLECEPGV